MATNRILYFLAGAVVGAAGMAFATSPKGREIISDVIQGGAGLKGNVASKMETFKEDIEDYVAEAKYKRAQKKAAPTQEADTETEIPTEEAASDTA